MNQCRRAMDVVVLNVRVGVSEAGPPQLHPEMRISKRTRSPDDTSVVKRLKSTTGKQIQCCLGAEEV